MKASGEQPIYRTAPSSPSTQDTDLKVCESDTCSPSAVEGGVPLSNLSG